MNIKEKTIQLLIKLFILSLLICICKSVMMIEANIPGTAECINMPSISTGSTSTNYSNITKGSTAVYANGLYTTTTNASGKYIFNSSSGPYGQWVNSGISINGSGTQTLNINVAGSVFMNNYNGNICVYNNQFNSPSPSPQGFIATIYGAPITISSGTVITANLLNDDATNTQCGGNTGSTISWGQGTILPITGSSATSSPAFSYNGTDWTDGGSGQGNQSYGANGIGMGVGLCSTANISGSVCANLVDQNNKNYDYSNQSSANSTNNIAFFQTTPTHSTYSGYGFSITGTSSSNETLAFNLYNCENCLQCNFGKCQAQNCADKPSTSSYAVSACPLTQGCNSATTGHNKCSVININCCVEGSADLILPSPKITYYSQNQGQYAFHLSAQDCISYGNSPVSCTAYTGATEAGILQMAITSGDPNISATNIISTTDLSSSVTVGTYNSINSTNYSYTQNNLSPTGQIWYRINDEPYGCDNNGENCTNNNSYQNNTGQLVVDTQLLTLSTGVIDNYILPSLGNIKTQLLGARAIIYDNIAIGAGTYTTIILAIVNLYIVIYGILFITGLVQGNYTDIVIRLAKIGFIFNFLGSDGGWNFFSTYFLGLFEQGGAYLGEIILNAPADIVTSTNSKGIITTTTTNNFESYVFGFFANTIGYVLNPNLWLIITTLVGSIGFVLALCLMYCMFVLLKVVFQMIISYIFALVSFSLIVSVAPIFISFSLFDRTKNYFRMWYQQLFYFALQPVLMFMTTLFFFSIINNFLTNIMSFQVCKTIYPLIIGGITILSFLDYQPVGLSIFTLIPSILSLLCLTKLLERSADLGGQIASSLTSIDGPPLSLTGKHSLAGSIAGAIGSTTQKLLGVDKASKARRDYAATRDKEIKNNKIDPTEAIAKTPSIAPTEAIATTPSIAEKSQALVTKASEDISKHTPKENDKDSLNAHSTELSSKEVHDTNSTNSSDHHKVLGLKSDATEREVTVAYRKLAIKLHPDKSTKENKEEDSQRFTEVSNAYQALKEQFEKNTENNGDNVK